MMDFHAGDYVRAEREGTYINNSKRQLGLAVVESVGPGGVLKLRPLLWNRIPRRERGPMTLVVWPDCVASVPREEAEKCLY